MNIKEIRALAKIVKEFALDELVVGDIKLTKTQHNTLQQPTKRIEEDDDMF